MANETNSWSLKPAKIRPRTYRRIVLPAHDDGRVHLSFIWYVLDNEVHEETLCGYSTITSRKYPRPTTYPTCVACIATWMARPADTVE